MDTQLQDIIETIHDRGVKEAEHRAHEIIETAEKRAQQIIDQARRTADETRRAAEQDAQRSKAAGEAALRQAARDLLLSVRADLEAAYGAVQRAAVGEALTADRMASAIGTMIDGMIGESGDTIEILVNEKDRAGLEAALQQRLAGNLMDRTEVRPVGGISAGFRIGTRESAVYVDVTDEALAEMLATFLNPRLTQLVQDGVAGRD